MQPLLSLLQSLRERLWQEHIRPVLFFGCVVALGGFSLLAVVANQPPSPELEGEMVDQMVRQQLMAAAGEALATGLVAEYDAMVGTDLYVTSNVAGGVLWLDGDSLGAAPQLLTDLAPGAYAVRLVGSNGISRDTTIVLSENSFTRLHLAVPERRVQAPRAAAPVQLQKVQRQPGDRVGWSGASPPAPQPRQNPRQGTRVAW